MRRKCPDGVSEDTWLRVFNAGKLDAFERVYEQQRKKGFSGVDAGKLACVKLFPQAPKQPAAPDELEERGLPQANSEPLLIDETRTDRKISRDDFRDKPPISVTACAEWVMDSMDRADVTKDDCPSAGAWSMLKQVCEDKASRRDFYKTFLPKLMPTGAQNANKGRQRDDGRNLDAEIELLLKEYRGSDAQKDDILNRAPA